MSKSWFTSLFLSTGIIVDQMLKGSLAQITNSGYSETQVATFFLSLKLSQTSPLDSIVMISNTIISIFYFLAILLVGKLYVTAFRTNQMGALIGLVILLTGLLSNFFDRSVAGHAFNCFLFKLNSTYFSFSLADLFLPIGLSLFLYFKFLKRAQT